MSNNLSFSLSTASQHHHLPFFLHYPFRFHPNSLWFSSVSTLPQPPSPSPPSQPPPLSLPSQVPTYSSHFKMVAFCFSLFPSLMLFLLSNWWLVVGLIKKAFCFHGFDVVLVWLCGFLLIFVLWLCIWSSVLWLGLFFFVFGSPFLWKVVGWWGWLVFQGLRLENSSQARLWVFVLLSLSSNSSWQDEWIGVSLCNSWMGCLAPRKCRNFYGV